MHSEELLPSEKGSICSFISSLTMNSFSDAAGDFSTPKYVRLLLVGSNYSFNSLSKDPLDVQVINVIDIQLCPQ